MVYIYETSLFCYLYTIFSFFHKLDQKHSACHVTKQLHNSKACIGELKATS